MRKILSFGIVLLFILLTISSSTGLYVEKWDNTNVEKTSTKSGDDIEIYIYAGLLPRFDYTKGPSFGFGIMMEIFNNLSEPFWVYWQRDYYRLISGEPLDIFGWSGNFVVPPNDSTWAGSSGWVGIPCRITVTVQVDNLKYESRTGFQFRRCVFFPGEK